MHDVTSWCLAGEPEGQRAPPYACCLSSVDGVYGHPVRLLSPLPPMWLESRMALEMAALCRDEILWGRGIPAGFGEPVLLIPGYLAGDVTLSTMAGWLTRIGYCAARAGMRVNAGSRRPRSTRSRSGWNARWIAPASEVRL